MSILSTTRRIKIQISTSCSKTASVKSCIVGVYTQSLKAWLMVTTELKIGCTPIEIHL